MSFYPSYFLGPDQSATGYRLKPLVVIRIGQQSKAQLGVLVETDFLRFGH